MKQEKRDNCICKQKACVPNHKRCLFCQFDGVETALRILTGDDLLYLLVGVLDLESLLLGLVPQLGQPLEEQRVWAGWQDAFPTQPGRFRGGHSFSPDRRITTLKQNIYCGYQMQRSKQCKKKQHSPTWENDELWLLLANNS